MDKAPKVWLCPACTFVIGHVVFGELYIDEQRILNTDGANLIVQCPQCGYRKVWYAEDKLDKLINGLAAKIAEFLSVKLR